MNRVRVQSAFPISMPRLVLLSTIQHSRSLSASSEGGNLVERSCVLLQLSWRQNCKDRILNLPPWKVFSALVAASPGSFSSRSCPRTMAWRMISTSLETGPWLGTWQDLVSLLWKVFQKCLLTPFLLPPLRPDTGCIGGHPRDQSACCCSSNVPLIVSCCVAWNVMIPRVSIVHHVAWLGFCIFSPHFSP